jgi:hypothetical protein
MAKACHSLPDFAARLALDPRVQQRPQPLRALKGSNLVPLAV